MIYRIRIAWQEYQWARKYKMPFIDTLVYVWYALVD